MKKKKNVIDEISIKMMILKDSASIDQENEIIREMNALTDINMVGRDGRSLLIHAACYNQISIVQYLLNANADLNKQDDLGFTALHAAVENHHYDMIKLLLEAGANVNAVDNFGNTPLQRASHQKTEIIQLLLSGGADPSIKNNYGISAFDSFAAYPNIIEMFGSID